jgi:hypothetical protein
VAGACKHHATWSTGGPAKAAASHMLPFYRSPVDVHMHESAHWQWGMNAWLASVSGLRRSQGGTSSFSQCATRP